jgi:hypothetical protein
MRRGIESMQWLAYRIDDGGTVVAISGLVSTEQQARVTCVSAAETEAREAHGDGVARRLHWALATDPEAGALARWNGLVLELRNVTTQDAPSSWFFAGAPIVSTEVRARFGCLQVNDTDENVMGPRRHRRHLSPVPERININGGGGVKPTTMESDYASVVAELRVRLEELRLKKVQ